MISRNVFLVGALTLSSSAAFAGGIAGLQSGTSLIFGNATVDHVHGGIWVGGNLTQAGSNDLGNEFVNNPAKSLDVVRVKGDMTWNNNNVDAIKNGNVKVGGGLNLSSPQWFNNSGYSYTSHDASVTAFSKDPFTQLSNALAGVSGTKLTSISNPVGNQYDTNNAHLSATGAANFNKNGGPNVFVYDLTDSIGKFGNLNFDSGFSSTDTIILDVNLTSGQSLNLNGFNTNLHGVKESQILWNFHVNGAASLSWNNQLSGSVLAPNVDVSFGNNLIGQLVSNSLNFTAGEIHVAHNGGDSSFDGNIGKIDTVPEPFSMSLLAAGVGLYVRRRIKKS